MEALIKELNHITDFGFSQPEEIERLRMFFEAKAVNRCFQDEENIYNTKKQGSNIADNWLLHIYRPELLKARDRIIDEIEKQLLLLNEADFVSFKLKLAKVIDSRIKRDIDGAHTKHAFQDETTDEKELWKNGTEIIFQGKSDDPSFQEQIFDYRLHRHQYLILESIKTYLDIEPKQVNPAIPLDLLEKIWIEFETDLGFENKTVFVESMQGLKKWQGKNKTIFAYLFNQCLIKLETKDRTKIMSAVFKVGNRHKPNSKNPIYDKIESFLETW